MTGHITLSDAMKHFGVSEKTIRRWIQQCKIEAEKVDGRWQISLNGHDDRTLGQNDRSNDQTPLIDQLRSEIEHLRDQLLRRDEQVDHLTQVVAMSQKNVAMLSEQLDSSRQMIEDLRHRPPLWRRLLRWT